MWPTWPPRHSVMSWWRAIASRGGCPSKADEKGAGEYPLTRHSKYRAHRGACGKTQVVPQNRRTYGGGKSEMHVLPSTHGSRADVEPMAGLAVRSRALGAQVRGCAPT